MRKIKPVFQYLSASLLVLAACLLAGCQPVPPTPGLSPLAFKLSPLPTPTATPRPTPTPLSPIYITVLHTNDTWGYLWPCG